MKHSWYVVLGLGVAGSASAAPLPDPVRAMIESALQSNEPQTVAAIITIAKKTNPDSVAEIDALTSDFSKKIADAAKAKADAERERLATAGAFALWTGQLELGGSWSTGNTRSLGLYGAVKATRKGLNWQHDLSARIDYQETDKVPTTERAVAAWQPRRNLGPVYYAYGLTQYEHDRFLGYQHRLTAGVGLGVVAVNNPRMRLEIDLGPALRYTTFYDDEPREERVAGRGSLSLKWTPWPRLTIAQDVAVYVQKEDTTATATTSIETLLFGPLKARLSYNVQYERDAPPDQKRTDTVSRASLVYGF